ncbi:hypothetical protein BBO_01557 [Beauveria brongniartii RCEF 3172]|uniref:Uncharacterized protein n=1 Tax=Beauveria brongniartii RCEF 3172 TaxID=1081107 RepID=A0A167J8H6_9HYPO|nr:hypothetical protein BBO_01557 [Beauveria brongniartii RCEF 3172]
MNTSTNDIDGLSHGLNEASLSDAAPKSNFCSTCVKALHFGNLPAAGCVADGDDLDREHRFIGPADVLEPSIQKHARALYEELCKKAMFPATSVGHDGPTVQEGAHLEEGKPDEDLAVHHRKLLDWALLKTALKATNSRLPFPSGDPPTGIIYRFGGIGIKVRAHKGTGTFSCPRL